jgi:hypothetical protein
MIDDQFFERPLKRRTGWMTAWPNEADARDCLGIGKSIRVTPEWDCLVTAGLTVQPKPEAENGSMAPEASSMQVRTANRYSNGHSGRQLVGPVWRRNWWTCSKPPPLIRHERRLKFAEWRTSSP